MAATGRELEELQANYEKLRRAVRRHLFFWLACIVVALVARRAMNYPPMLSWPVFAVPVVVFGADFIRLIACRIKLSRHRDSLSE